jgi:hypothetical protein
MKKADLYRWESTKATERVESNERVANVFENPGNEGARIQYPAGIANHPNKPEHDKEVLGDEAG